ncbi:hypothetical protein LEP1GSC074_2620 [Leptospira noguchii str. Hook]|nr:hypothetical protein LEP1GSC074_2620 [Leptospira noguchii str. Hook]
MSSSNSNTPRKNFFGIFVIGFSKWNPFKFHRWKIESFRLPRSIISEKYNLED